jgi:hypothetical protein
MVNIVINLERKAFNISDCDEYSSDINAGENSCFMDLPS